LGLLLWKAVLLALYSGGFSIICGAFAIIRNGSSRLYAVQLSPSYRVLLPFNTRCFHHFNIRGGFAIYIRSGSSIIRGAFNIIRDAFIQHYFHILSCICGWQCFLVFASGLQWQWHALKRFIYVLCEFYILSYSVDLLVINLCIYKWI
jgi:hypothetical protein